MLELISKEFNQMEMLSIVVGNFTQVTQFKDRVQKVLKAAVPNEGRTKEDRRRYVSQGLEAIKKVLSVPE